MKITKHSAVSLLLLTIMLIAPQVYAGAKIEIDDTKSFSIGLGYRSSFESVGDGASNGSDQSMNFRLNNLRLYTGGQLHKNVKFEFNTECNNCPDSGGEMIILDAIAKFEFSKYFNIWAGRLLVPADRAELDGPFYQNTFEFNKTPFYPSDFGNFTAGRFGRDDGVNIWGALTGDGRLTYVVGMFDGVDGGTNTTDSPLYAGRISYNYLNIEQNPGYYTSSTYYGKAGNILTFAFALQHQNDAVGVSGVKVSPFTGWSTDLLYERVLHDNSVITFEGEAKVFDSDVGIANNEASCFCPFNGVAWTTTGLYLFPEKVALGALTGQFQPYVRYTENKADNFVRSREEIEFGTNYVMDGHNARLSLMFQYGDIATKGRNWFQSTDGDNVGAIKIGLQFQL